MNGNSDRCVDTCHIADDDWGFKATLKQVHAHMK